MNKEMIRLAKKYSKTNNKKACKISWKMFYTGLGGHQFNSNKKLNNGEIYCPESDCKTCIEK